jgi:hypothetical protein
MSEYVIPVPGWFRPEAAYVDLETEKVPTAGFVMKNGEVLKNRWSAFLAGVGAFGEIRLVERDGSEEFFLGGVREAIGDAEEVVYGATREFDEMILKGRFTNARRAHEPVPFYPALPDADGLAWVNEGTGKADFRSPDVASREVPVAYRDGRYESVMIHNLRDVAELIWLYGEPDAECSGWLARVLVSDEFAREVIFGGE